MRASPAVAVVAVVALGVGLVATVRLSPPPDLGAWAPVALPGEAVLTLADRVDGVLVGTTRGLQHLAPDGTLTDLDVPGRVRALAEHPGGTFVGTADGLLDLREAPTGRPVEAPRPVLAGTGVTDVHVVADVVVVGGSSGLLRRADGDDWDRLWPPEGQPDEAVLAVLATTGGVLFAHPDGLALLTHAGVLDVVVPDVAVVELHHDVTAGLLWAGTRGGPMLLVSDDDGRTWRTSADGLGLSAVETVVRPPGSQGTLVVGGSGLADGTGNAGTETSTDDGRTWQTRQDRLSNTHVYALLARNEPWRLEARLLGTDARLQLPLPVSTTRLYAGTNGGGVSTRRPEVPALATLAPAVPVLRVLEPLLAGALLLLCLLPAYRHLWRGSAATTRPPPAATTPAAETPTSGTSGTGDRTTPARSTHPHPEEIR